MQLSRPVGIILGLLLITSTYIEIFAQGTPFPPPRELKVYSIQGLNFGNFYTGVTGGTITISPSGMRTSSGNVILAGGYAQQAIYEVELLPGRQIHIILGQQATLTRIGGSGQLTMTIGPSDKGTGFITSAPHPFLTPVQIGAILHVGSIQANPSGQYQGVFSVTFVQE